MKLHIIFKKSLHVFKQEQGAIMNTINTIRKPIYRISSNRSPWAFIFQSLSQAGLLVFNDLFSKKCIQKLRNLTIRKFRILKFSVLENSNLSFRDSKFQNSEFMKF
ncbi:hypothetical protein L3Y34_015020 [Caenorhabditis briggsae]|uniref:Uncharacterized protein n=1 Tax=Caenorhabditis briggsae TaxID=6238 RepID=A0AAE9IZ62_CAEBR|nr:hypothetical protein L3Y34_015020 [Caenorhabditis briggsae]